MDSKTIVGKSEEMCPEKEFKFRKKHNLIHVLEKTVDGQTDRRLCIKEFRRSAAGEKLADADLLRSGSVLVKTAKYLVSQVAFSKNCAPTAVYEFVFDRLRSVRQDMVIQQLPYTEKETALEILCLCCRYYVYIDFNTKFNVEELKIDKHIHLTHLHDCLNSFVKLAFKESKLNDHLLEIVYSYLLLNLDSEQCLMNVLINFPEILKRNNLLSSVVELCLLMIRKDNYFRIVLLYKSIYARCSNFTKMLLCISLAKVRTMFLGTLCTSHNSKTFNFPITVLQNWLFLSDSKSTVQFCSKHGLSCTEVKVNLSKSKFNIEGMFYSTSCPVFKYLTSKDVCFNRMLSS